MTLRTFSLHFFTDAYKSGVSKQIQRQHTYDDTSLLLSDKVVLTIPGNFLCIS